MNEKEAILVLTAEAEGNARRSPASSRDRRVWERQRAAAEVLVKALKAAKDDSAAMETAAAIGELHRPAIIAGGGADTGIVDAAPARESDDTFHGPLRKKRPEKIPTRIEDK